MATNTATEVQTFLDAVAPAGRRRDALALLELMREATGLEPTMSGSSIVGFGEYSYEYDSGRKGTAPAAGFSPRKAATTIYLLDGIAYHEAALEKLGPHTTGVGCLYIKDLSKVDLRVLKGIVRKSFKQLTAKTYGKRARDAAATKAPKKSTRTGSAKSPIDTYLEGIENLTARATLTRLCEHLRELLPTATETISYNMPAFRLPNGKVAAGFAFFGKNCGYYPHSGNVVPKLGALVDGYKGTKGGIAFPPDKPLPKKIVSALVRTRLAEIAEKEAAPKKPKKAATKPATGKTTTSNKATAKTATAKTATTKASVTKPASADAAKKPRIFAMSFASVYPLYVQKVEKKGRTQQEVDEVIAWLTGYRGKALQRAIDKKVDFEAFFGAAPRWNPKAELITGVICGVRVEDVADPLMQKIRYLDKLVDELARGKKLESILRS
ncbi:MAG: DUF2200 family protein [Polyangiaceae bacterium]|nr:DUF2200 family protein [Polyangiaceae bacterium]